MSDLPDRAALRAHMGTISPMAARKVLPALDWHCRAFIALSPFLVAERQTEDARRARMH